MVYNYIINGTKPDAIKVMENFNYVFGRSFTFSGLNMIRILQDRSIYFSKGMQDMIADAYIDSNGRCLPHHRTERLDGNQGEGVSIHRLCCRGERPCGGGIFHTAHSKKTSRCHPSLLGVSCHSR